MPCLGFRVECGISMLGQGHPEAVLRDLRVTATDTCRGMPSARAACSAVKWVTAQLAAVAVRLVFCRGSQPRVSSGVDEVCLVWRTAGG